MTPAIRALESAGVMFRVLPYDHDPSAVSYGLEAAELLGLDPDSVFKTLVADLAGGTLVVAVVPVSGQLDLKALAKSQGAKKATMADPVAAERATGYVTGGISPLGQKTPLAVVVDASSEVLDEMFVSAGRRGLDLGVAPADLIALSGAMVADIAKR